VGKIDARVRSMTNERPKEKRSQERAFLETEAGAWFRRNPDSVVAAACDDPVLAALRQVDLKPCGLLLDVGVAAGRIAAGFLRDHPAWETHVIEPSADAIHAGQKAFPQISFQQASITQAHSISDGGQYDVVVVSGVLCWVQRDLLSLAVANIDGALADGGLVVISDFDAPYPRANPYTHLPGLFTYKQNYSACFLGLGIYQLEFWRSYTEGPAYDPSDPYDCRWSTALLRKDVQSRYARPPL
jgi:SAM-dependent methyltransferase